MAGENGGNGLDGVDENHGAEGDEYEQTAGAQIRLFPNQQKEQPKQQYDQQNQQIPIPEERQNALQMHRQQAEIDDHQHGKVGEKRRPGDIPQENRGKPEEQQRVQGEHHQKGNHGIGRNLRGIPGVEKHAGK